MNRAPILTFSHLRWNSVFQRPHHIMSRLASRRDVLFVEEPVPHRGETEIDILRVAPRLNVLQPRIPCDGGGFGSGKQRAGIRAPEASPVAGLGGIRGVALHAHGGDAGARARAARDRL